MEGNDAIDITKSWIEKFIIGYNICPFARLPFEKSIIDFSISSCDTLEGVLMELFDGFNHMITTDAKNISNAFIILDNWKLSFEELLEVTAFGYSLLEDMGIEDRIQLVAFHPDFRYENEEPGSPANLTNRSPFPMIHLLRSDEVEEAINSHNHIDEVPIRNKNLLLGLSEEEILAIRNAGKSI
jgi:hypothetical protein